MSDLTKQVGEQCRAVVHMAEAIAEVYRARQQAFERGAYKDDMANIIGRWSAETMEMFGDILNGMDAVTDEDEWVNPIMEEAKRRWPPQAAA